MTHDTKPCPQNCHFAIPLDQESCPACDPAKRRGELDRMSKTSRSKFVRDYIARRIYTTADAPEHDPLQSFLACKLMPPATMYTQEALQTIGVIYEYLSEAGPVAIDGRPTFLSYRLMHIDDWKLCVAAILRAQKALEDIEA